MAERPTPAAVFQRLKEHQPTIFYGVPTLFGAMLASPDLPAADEISLRVCASAGEALPADLGRRWTEHFGTEILDGIGSTEMLHIFMSNRPGDVRYGTTGKPVPGHDVAIIDANNGNMYIDGTLYESQGTLTPSSGDDDFIVKDTNSRFIFPGRYILVDL